MPQGQPSTRRRSRPRRTPSKRKPPLKKAFLDAQVRRLRKEQETRAAVKKQINTALGRIQKGMYGICVVSGKPIPKRRLESKPWADRRAEHEGKKSFKRRKTPGARKPPLANTFLEEQQAALREAQQEHTRVVKQINTALGRIQKGTYGICVGCGKPIPKRRLESRPWADRCAEPRRTPSNRKPPLSDKFLDAQERKLLKERERLTSLIQRLQEDADELVRDREPGDVQDEGESGQGDTLSVERGQAQKLIAEYQEIVEEIDAALVRINDGTYGICAISGKIIQVERLKVLPWATTRVDEKAGGY